MSNANITEREAQLRALALFDRGLVALPCWGGGKALPGRDHRALADNPPSREQVAAADYSGGLAILLGTAHPLGGFTVAADLDHGPTDFPWRPSGFLNLEGGTAPGRWHIFPRTLDRLEGVVNLRDTSGALVCEVKGRGHALRSFPTLPEGKARGYTPVELVRDPAVNPPKLTAYQVAEGMADLLSRVLGRDVTPDFQRPRGTGRVMPAPAGLAAAVEEELARRGVVLGRPGRDGWQLGRCPFHQDRRHPSFSVSWEIGAWKCWTRCGSGGLRTLADKLGLFLPGLRHGRQRSPVVVTKVTL